MQLCPHCEQYRLAPEYHSLALNRCVASEVYGLHLCAHLLYLLFNCSLLGVQAFIFLRYSADPRAFLASLQRVYSNFFQYTVFISVSFIFSLIATAVAALNFVTVLLKFEDMNRIKTDLLEFIQSRKKGGYLRSDVN
jgi:hypothetical protein